MKIIIIIIALLFTVMFFFTGCYPPCTKDKLAAVIVNHDVEYKCNGETMQGYRAYDELISGTRPGVIIVHEWNGLGDYVKERAKKIARLGYVAFCADIYGKSIRANSMEESAKLAGTYRSNPKILRE